MKYRLQVTAQAAQDIERCKAWWRKHRDKAPERLSVELERVFERLKENPSIGQPYKRRGFPGVRRIGLNKTPYQLYYAVEDGEVIVITLWSSMRKRGPALKIT